MVLTLVSVVFVLAVLATLLVVVWLVQRYGLLRLP